MQEIGGPMIVVRIGMLGRLNIFLDRLILIRLGS